MQVIIFIQHDTIERFPASPPFFKMLMSIVKLGPAVKPTMVGALPGLTSEVIPMAKRLLHGPLRHREGRLEPLSAVEACRQKGALVNSLRVDKMSSDAISSDGLSSREDTRSAKMCEVTNGLVGKASHQLLKPN